MIESLAIALPSKIKLAMINKLALYYMELQHIQIYLSHSGFSI